MSNLIESVREFILSCPFLRDWRVNVDYLGAEMEYSIDPLPCDPIMQRYTDGGSKRQFQFAFSSRQEYDQDARINIENSGFYELFGGWLEQKSSTGELPELPAKKYPARIEILNSGYLYDVDGNKARYLIECRLIYTQEA